MLAVGQRVGAYEIVSSLGAGGMGEVYRARDTRLKRDVALKILLPSVVDDPDRLLRFTREAQLLASLNHPHIAHLHGIEEAASTGPGQPVLRALVMELVEGPTLADRISRGAIPIDEALPIAAQIADALEAAHAQGIVHRDLKPANIKVRPDGTVKVLDFGLAKALEPAAEPDGASALANSPTITAPAMTQQGVILGTAPYMSPEQARGAAVDRRTDIWAFGCVVYEMLSGRAPFAGGTVSDVIAAIIGREPEWAALPAPTPQSVRRLLRRCLEKDRRRRLADAADAKLEIEEGLGGSPADAALPPRRGMRPVAVASALGAMALVTAFSVWAVMHPGPLEPLAATRFAIVPAPASAVVATAAYRDIALSRDGDRIVYSGPKGQLFVRALDELDPAPLAGIANALDAFLSPDGRWVAFFTGVSGELRKMSIDGGVPVALCRYTGSPRGGSWGVDDTIVFATNEPTTGLFRVGARGGSPEMLTKPDASKAMESDHLLPSVLPDGRGVLFTITATSSSSNAQIAVLDLKTGQHRIVIQRGSQGEYIPTGHLVYASAGSLWAIAFDLDSLESRGDPVLVVPEVLASAGAAKFSVSRTGTLAYLRGTPGGGAEPSTLVWVRRDGRVDPVAAPPHRYRNPRISGDGARVVLALDEPDYDIFSWDFARRALTRLTFDPGHDWYPGWTPDGRAVVFTSGRTGVPHLFRRLADGTGREEQLTSGSNVQFGSPSFSLDGTRLVFNEVVPGSGEDVMQLALSGTPHTEPLLHTNFAERNARISPDGRWVAYESNESGQEEIYVRPFPNVADGRWQISNEGGKDVAWASSGRELFYREGTSVMASSVQTSPTFEAGTPVRLFDGPYRTDLSNSFDVSRDGQRFLMVKEPASSPASIVVVINWFEELKKKVAAGGS